MKRSTDIVEFRVYCRRRKPTKVVLASDNINGCSLPAAFITEFHNPKIETTLQPNQVAIVSDTNRISFSMVDRVKIITCKAPRPDEITLHCGMYGSPEISATLFFS